jgi:hypothetical protein
MHLTDFERDTSSGHSRETGTTQTIGAAGLIWTLRGPINSVEIRALTDCYWRCQSREYYWWYAWIEIHVMGVICPGPERGAFV